MTDKERLEEIKTWLNRGFDLTEEDINWLIKQSERVQELEDVNSQLERQTIGIELELLNMELTDALKQNKRYREAINNIIEKAMLFGTNEEVYEAIQDALKALENKIEK